jgi:hypothetical protein
MTEMMKCGHAANAQVDTPTGPQPVCAICYGIMDGASEIWADAPDLTGRLARCMYCSATAPSMTTLAFFEHRPLADQDRFYDGCRGWD